MCNKSNFQPNLSRPGWYSNSQHVVIHGNDKLLKKDTEWDWDTFGVHIKSHINEFVVMEECVYGAGAKDLRQKDPAVMHRGHELWDTALKALSEMKQERCGPNRSAPHYLTNSGKC